MYKKHYSSFQALGRREIVTDFNGGLAKEIEEERPLTKVLSQCSGKASRVFKNFCYKTLQTWRWNRRVIGKAEHLAKGANPRFVVTSLSAEEEDATVL